MAMTGGCLCGNVHYRIEGDPTFINSCYCSDCRRESGAGHLTFVAVPTAALVVDGETRTFVKQADSGKSVHRIFCPNCGTTILGQPEALGGISMIRAGTLDHNPPLKPSHAVFASSATPWDKPPEGMRLFERMPHLK